VPAPSPEAEADALDQAALRLRPSWDVVGGDDSSDAPPPGWAGSAPAVEPPAVAAPPVAAPAIEQLAPAAAAPAVESERPKPRTAPSVDGAATIIVNEPGVIVLDAPPAEFRVHRPEPEGEPPPVVWDASKGPDLLGGGSSSSSVMQPTLKLADLADLPAEDTDFSAPLTSRRPLLWVAGGALLGAIVLVFALRGGDEASKPASPAPSLVTETAAAAPAPAPAPEAPVVAAPPAPEEPVAAAEPEPAPVVAAPVEPPKPAAAKRGRHGRASGPARMAKAERAERAEKADKAPAQKPVAIRANNTTRTPNAAIPAKKARKGAGFVSANPYGP
jgi:hypothetical protein